VKITAVEVEHRRLPLTKPYTISRETIVDVELSIVKIRAGGLCGFGCASPAVEVTGESPAQSRAALAAAAELLHGRDVCALGSLVRLLGQTYAAAPAARAACDMALWDLLGQVLDVPVIDLLGRAQLELPTSVTIGLQSTDAALDAAREYLSQGFRALKVKLGHAVDEEIDRLRQLRALVGPGIALRTDPNAGYDAQSLRRYLDGTRGLDIEFCEQPLPREADDILGGFVPAERARFAADESVLDLRDAGRLLQEERRYGIYNLKLMKCGGISPAQRIAHLAEGAGIALMWGCNDESRISIAAALHVALASPATRYLDLDGSFDLASDVVAGGFELVDGRLRPAAGPGLGLRAID
jgi:L-alanine-DL-glutamate epimerase-like enolase superfamily enzyme